MLWRFSPLPAGFWDGVSGTHIWPSAGFSKPTITNDELEILFPGINPVRVRSGQQTNQTQSINLNMKLHPMLAIFNLGGTELVLILGVALLLFGGKKLPELAKGLGQGIREFKKATKAVTDEVQNVTEEKPAQKLLMDSPSQPAQTVSQSPNPAKA
jgi:sec-independent protein translocase protein TatA